MSSEIVSGNCTTDDVLENLFGKLRQICHICGSIFTGTGKVYSVEIGYQELNLGICPTCLECQEENSLAVVFFWHNWPRVTFRQSQRMVQLLQAAIAGNVPYC